MNISGPAGRLRGNAPQWVGQFWRLVRLSWGIPLLLVCTLWVARYWRSADFGWYEDDWTIAPRAAQMSGGEVLGFVGDYIVHLYGHARPLSDSLIYIFSHLGWKVGGMWGAYWVGFAIEALNALLFYVLLRRLAVDWGLQADRFALIGGLAYVLFAADTTQAFLTHSLGLHPSITLLLLALFFYRKGWLGYPLAGIILFSYETPFLVFLAAPLLENRPWKDVLRRGLLHALIIGLMLLGVFGLRVAVGEGRVADLSTFQMVQIPLLHMFQGPVVSLGTFALRPIQALVSGQWEVYIAFALALLVLGWIFSRIGEVGSSQVANAGRHCLRLALAGGDDVGDGLPIDIYRTGICHQWPGYARTCRGCGRRGAAGRLPGVSVAPVAPGAALGQWPVGNLVWVVAGVWVCDPTRLCMGLGRSTSFMDRIAALDPGCRQRGRGGVDRA